MRITGGKHRGRTLPDPVAAGVRPTSERAREALFSILGQNLTGQSVLDAYGGTGLLGLEAWSRGAEVVAVEKDKAAATDLLTRAKVLGASHEAGFALRIGDVLAVAPSLGPFDGVLVDPPWALDPGRILSTLGPLARHWLVLEADCERECPDVAGDLGLDRVRRYGRTAFWVYRVSAS